MFRRHLRCDISIHVHRVPYEVVNGNMSHVHLYDNILMSEIQKCTTEPMSSNNFV